MCGPDWLLVPKPLKDAVWATYVPGQEIRKDPTPAYIKAAHNAILAVADAKGTPVPPQVRRRWLEENDEQGESRRRRNVPVSPAW